MYKIPETLEKIPCSYRRPADYPGRLEVFNYQTKDALDLSCDLSKRALVYLPYDYDKRQPYDIVYLSHGGWSTEESLMGTPKAPDSFKHVIDHAIAAGKIKPMINVLVTYNNRTSRDSWNYSLAIELTKRFHRELIQDLLPALESHYSTYAKSASLEDLRASRLHRGFAGFSMGSVNTWRTFEYALDYFAYFMPMSGNVKTNKLDFEQLVQDKQPSFFIFAMSGDRDFAYEAFKEQVVNLQGLVFRFADNEAKGNIAFREMPGYQHDKLAADTYTYNGLQFFWKNHMEAIK
ncbi:alpha/beta hydrolase [Streptococcus macacae]|uniref:Esterase domain protein n=1 Tax=Streptococcus macacae NCTC 11558 TaxID=764298 RepID=G5JZ42_9STRE|nr:alpha/beta hydrolase-fold protein [Streptococcus macacae]EHJ52478.1 esterase domain protein [Streptococcus macacae NCTC 11558]SUN78295.1 Endo-1,4-beta-xylanase Y precursor [Streptococcus macacae NCTC 11558]